MLVDVVDDNPAYRKLLRLLVELGGHRVRMHDTAESAFAAMHHDPPALAVIDVQLAGPMGGLELTRELKTRAATSRVAVIVVTAHAALADEAQARAVGADAWLAKPIDTQEFTRCVARLTGRAT